MSSSMSSDPENAVSSAFSPATGPGNPDVQGFFDPATNTVSYVVSDGATKRAAVIDSVLDFDAASGRTSTASADALASFVRAKGLSVECVLETHLHADHLSAAPYLKAQVGGWTGIGSGIAELQKHFGALFNAGGGFACDGSQFERLLGDGDRFPIGQLECRVLHTPGHTPACVTYLIGDAAFVGDTLFMPDYGTARCDFPGGDARLLYRSIMKLYALPPETRIFLCHDYKAEGREEYRWQSSVAEQRAKNIHLRDGVDEAGFVALRRQRDATLSMPRLLLPSVQVNMRGGELPPAEENGVRYLKIPLNAV